MRLISYELREEKRDGEDGGDWEDWEDWERLFEFLNDLTNYYGVNLEC